MRLLEVNNISLLGASHQEAVNALRCAGNTIRLVVCKGKLSIYFDYYHHSYHYSSYLKLIFKTLIQVTTEQRLNG